MLVCIKVLPKTATHTPVALKILPQNFYTANAREWCMWIVVFACTDTRHIWSQKTHTMTYYAGTPYKQTCSSKWKKQREKEHEQMNFTVLNCMIQTLCVYVSKHHDLFAVKRQERSDCVWCPLVSPRSEIRADKPAESSGAVRWRDKCEHLKSHLR